MKVTKSGRRSRAARTAAGATTLAARLPALLDATGTGARRVASALGTLPNPTLRWLAAGSVGLGTGLFLAGKPRLIIAAGMAPALAMGAAMVARPAQPVGPDVLVERPIEPAIPMVLVPVTTVGPKGGRPRRAALDPTRPGNGVRRA